MENPDTLPQWLAWRYGQRGKWEDEQSYWEHEAAAVRRAVERGGFKENHPATRFETLVQPRDVDYQDDRMFAQVEVMNDDDAEEDPFVRLCEYRDDAQHPFIDSLVGRRVRVTVEVIG